MRFVCLSSKEKGRDNQYYYFLKFQSKFLISILYYIPWSCISLQVPLMWCHIINNTNMIHLSYNIHVAIKQSTCTCNSIAPAKRQSPSSTCTYEHVHCTINYTEYAIHYNTCNTECNTL